ncbi:scavenger mRNA decapping enzyme carboxy-term-binding protein [Rhizoctonia solani AG-3 Rhs1AP]|uniref:Scavenger mRNA decapping enzyme carboxy-term-binding protein n=1 Tax=Rhizoctonia solani AG-3 Rhs1AP TaxID=1086054 RepID=X8IYH3_9AGAM|nr:scavenger mRNA decapping enzyme carboxy-term-binding protein [Rhizoctonia solani AG-3 Rhs1AP]
MTSHLIDKFVDRAKKWENLGLSCVFCDIISGRSPCYKIYETDQVIAILDIQPIRRGHALVMPKSHVQRLSELPPEIAGALGTAVSRVANAICQGLGITALNVVCNQEYAQAVPHVHYHIVPAPDLSNRMKNSAPDESNLAEGSSIFMKEWLRRSELDDTEGHQLSERIKSRL